MSVLLVVALVGAAALLSGAIVAAFRSYEGAADRVTEGTRQRILTGSPYGSHRSERGV